MIVVLGQHGPLKNEYFTLPPPLLPCCHTTLPLRDGSPAAVAARLLGHRRRSLSSRASTVVEFGVIELLCRTDGSTT